MMMLDASCIGMVEILCWAADWATKAKSAQGGLRSKLIGEPPKKPRNAVTIFSDEKLRLVKQSSSRKSWRAHSVPRDVQDAYEGLPEDKKQAWEKLAAGDHCHIPNVSNCPKHAAAHGFPHGGPCAAS